MSRWAEIRDGAVLYEDAAALVLNKPAGLAVMGERHDTDLVRLAAEAGQKLYPAHRIDKVTSGAVLFAKELRFHGDLTRQFNRHTAGKVYLAVTRSTGRGGGVGASRDLPERGTIDLPLSAGRKNRVRVAANRAAIVFDEASSRWWVPDDEVFGHVRVYPSRTTFLRIWGDGQHTLLAVRPVTGRRHQIRAHLAWTGHPIEGDPLFGKPSDGRTLLHSWWLAFDAAWIESGGGRRTGAGAERGGGESGARGRDQQGRRIEVSAPPGPDFWAPLAPEGPVPLPDAVAIDQALG
jgi:tRNA pseudouridine32 synthase / 23S rRNA pseudouridine746 synthase